MKLYKIGSIFSLLTLAFVGVSCSDDNDNYEWAPNVGHEEVYFPNNLGSKITLSSAATSFSIPVKRVGTTGSASAAISLGDTNGMLTLASNSVSFSEGADEANIVINYDPDKFEFDKYFDATVKIADEAVTSEYGVSEYTFSYGVPAPWTSLGIGTFNEDFYFGTGEVSVEIFRNDLDPDLYRVRNRIIDALYAWGEAVSDYASEWIYIRTLHPGDVCLGQTIPDDLTNLVYFYGDYTAPNGDNPVANLFNTGYHHPNYDEELCMVYPGRFSSLADPHNWVHNCVLGYKEDGTPGAIQLAGNYYMFGVGGFGGQTDDGDLVITFPGFVLADYSVSVSAVGRLIDVKENGQAIFDVVLGPDVNKALVAMAPGKDAMVAYQMILDGDESVAEITASGEVLFAYDEPGDYVCVVVSYDAEGEEQESAYTLINIPDNAAPTEVFEAVYTGIYTHGAKNLSTGGLPFGEGWEDPATLYASNLDDSRFMISPWVNMGYEEEGTEGQGMIFIWDDEDNITVPGSFTGVPSSYGDIYAWDLVTAGIADMPCSIDYDALTFNFNLVWSTESLIPNGQAFGYTIDTFVITGYAESPEKSSMKFSPAKTNKKLVCKKSFEKTLNIDTPARAKKHVARSYKLNEIVTLK